MVVILQAFGVKMTLQDFLKLYNFRKIYNERENTEIIRIYSDWPSDWFEFGVNDWSFDETNERIKMFIHPDILKKEVSSVNYDDVNEVFCITLYEKEPEETIKTKKST